MNQTSIEWLYELSKKRELDKFDLDQAKAMEKEQMIKFANNYLDDDADLTADQYYNETYNKTNI